MAPVNEGLAFTVESLKKYCKIISERLSPSGMGSLISLIKDLHTNRISQSEFSESIQLLFENDGKTQQDVEDTELEEGEIREDHVLAIGAKVDENSKGYRIHHGNLKIRGDVKIRVKVDENPKEEVSNEPKSEKYVTDVEGKKRSILLSDQTTDRSLKKPRNSMRLDRVTPSYKLIPEEEQSPVKCTVLNNKCSLMKFDDASGHKRLTKCEEAMARCEDEMFETDMLMERLRSAVGSAEKVLKGEMKVEDLGVLFYRCIQKLYREDMSEAVREDHKKALPVIILRLKQKLDNLTDVRKRLKPRWTKVFEENTAKQRDSTAKGQGKKFESDLG